ncbi:NAD(P)-binding protein [Rhizopogon vinicolor AM-OR11-026]|uniref:NAD(P)-binding protein n=1 Tax=Rhizopogon vinicolor AM-OR11-026 TaxID=1314800 RepID=A0A1B7NB24_9AGAM|nr:NAD(P)-binding protein [Rhizopogon vinicolor AM-OR11-026]
MSSYAITGAARGIGFEFVNQLSTDPENTVFALVRSKTTADRLVALGRPNVHILEADITNTNGLKYAAAEVARITGSSLDYLINNAGFVESERDGLTLESYSSEELLTKDLLDSFKVNVVGVIHTINIFLPLLKNGKAKKVVTISSGVGDLDLTIGFEIATFAPYSISKAAVNMANAKYAAQYKSEGFVFLAISPGVVDTSTRPPTADELERFNVMIGKLRKVYPDFTGPITPETSVRMQLEVINRTTVDDTGAFISHKGNKEWL